MIKEFEHELSKQGFIFQETPEGYYKITPKSRIVLPTLVQLVISKPINQIIHGSQNGNELDGIGYFHFSLKSEQSPDYYVFSFKHLRNDSLQYMVVSTDELRRRLKKNLIRYRNGEHLELKLWLMDGQLFDTSFMGAD